MSNVKRWFRRLDLVGETPALPGTLHSGKQPVIVGMRTDPEPGVGILRSPVVPEGKGPPMDADTHRIGGVLFADAFEVQAWMMRIGTPEDVTANGLALLIARQGVEVLPEASGRPRDHRAGRLDGS